jgi:SlyX protein
LTNIDDVVQQLVDVQTQLAYHEDLVGELNNALASQQQEILVLRRQLQLLKQRQDDQAPGPAGSGPAEETPPHY